GRELLEVARIVVGGVVDEHVDAAEAVDGRRDRRVRVLPVGDVELDDEEVIGLTERRCDGVRVAAGGNDVVAGGERRLGEVDAHATSGASDQPDLLVGSHGLQRTTVPSQVRVPVDRGTGRVSQAGVRRFTLDAWTPG